MHPSYFHFSADHTTYQVWCVTMLVQYLQFKSLGCTHCSYVSFPGVR